MSYFFVVKIFCYIFELNLNLIKMKKLLFTSFAILCSYLGYSQHNVLRIQNICSENLKVTVAGSQTSCDNEMYATYIIAANSSVNLDASTMVWNNGSYDNTNPNPINWHTIRAFDECDPTDPGYINFNGYCLTGQTMQSDVMVDVSCAWSVFGEFISEPGQPLMVIYHN